ncbi:SDR family NAD(P)-dependent oxidoreductase [Endozoicomonas ascidiicola]|uniref:SDR family NAD(P)-dependent oxidoreductase n=1 Tax=Endozoicomonas ascidiicola TaxID=1698521 RepID=UPI00083344E8|nr:SDR family NAD(P)-dependent oxidoreductase [Endozoicomonas ascidiicola]
MQKKILITGATDGIGAETAKALAAMGHSVLLHGRNTDKLMAIANELSQIKGAGPVEQFAADLSILASVDQLADAIAQKHNQLDIIISNAGVFKIPSPITEDGLDSRFVVNTIAPYRLTQKLMPLLGLSSRVVNLSSAAQDTVNLEALAGNVHINDDFTAYAQSKLALTMWSRVMAESLGEQGPAIIAVNPGSMLASKMVKEGFGVAGKDLSIGVDILCRAALSEEFSSASGLYFDNDIGAFSSPHPDALNEAKNDRVVKALEAVLEKHLK